MDDDEKYVDKGSIMGRSCERVLWEIGRQIVNPNKWPLWDATTRQFEVAPLDWVPPAPTELSKNGVMGCGKQWIKASLSFFLAKGYLRSL